ncbi:MAG: penicillin-binding protein 2 [Elusimicrobia bacterium]|nr:penicillin-binding protein 2 [Elusimicrobiota bacterium]
MTGRTPLYDRLDALWGLCYIGVAILGLRLLQLQVVQNVQYARAAERNRTQIIRQTAPRGRIYGRNGEEIATNQAAFSLIYMPDKAGDEKYLHSLAEDLAPLLKADPDDLLETLRRAVREESAIRLAENLPPKTMFKLSELKTIYPGVDLIVEARRHYPFGASAAHLLGYLGKMDDRSWRELKGKGYRVDSRIGKAGLEKIFERELRGVDGGIRMEVDAQGRLKRVLEKIDWQPGSNLYLTIDAKLQRVAEEALRKSPSGEGAAVVIDPRTGGLLVLASVPDFDPNQFLLPESTVDVKQLPEFNLATQGAFAPGSIFKIITGAAMLNEGKVDPADTVFCPGAFYLGTHRFGCWEKKGHKVMNWLNGLAFSCDVYFYRMGLRAGGDTIEKYQKMFGLGQRTRVGLPSEKRGNVFGPEARRARGLHWHDGDTCNLAIGQGELLVTPLQMALAMAAVANRGTLWRPHFLSRIEYVDRRRPEYRQKPEELGKVDLKPRTWELLHEALTQVVKSGTGGRLFTPGLEIAGKTGTAQNPRGEDHAWFVAYAGRPGQAPELALAVLAQHGGHGSDAAGPIAKKIIHSYFGIEAPHPPGALAVSTAAAPGLMRVHDLRPAQAPPRLR